MAVNVNFNDKHVDKYIFEYKPIMRRTLYFTPHYDLASCNNFRKFLLIIDNDDLFETYHYDTMAETIETRNKCNKKSLLLNVKKMNPYFINYEPYSRKCKNYFEFMSFI